jgi:tripartite-type tricarboxylate transporter receptor subunit TctC
MTNRRIILGTALALSAIASSPVLAQAQITKIVVPFAAGGGTDVYVRMLAEEMTKRGTRIIVENKPGASGLLAADYAAKQRPDGQTLLVTFLGILVTNTVIYEKLPYDPQKDFAPVSQIAYQPTIVVARADLPYNNVKQLVTYARANPGKVNRGSPGAAILSNLAPVAFEKEAGISTTHIPFNGDAQAIQALLSNSIDIYGTSITSSLPHIKSGKFKVLGVMDSKRLPQVPDAPTFKEMGYNFEAPLRYYLSVPAGTPKETVDKLNRVINEVLADPAFVARARAVGMEPKGSTPEEMSRFIATDADRWLPLLRSLQLPKQER